MIPIHSLVYQWWYVSLFSIVLLISCLTFMIITVLVFNYYFYLKYKYPYYLCFTIKYYLDYFSAIWGAEKLIEICEKRDGSRLSYLLALVIVSLSLPPSQGSQEYEWKFPATGQRQCQVTAGSSSTKNAVTA